MLVRSQMVINIYLAQVDETALEIWQSEGPTRFLCGTKTVLMEEDEESLSVLTQNLLEQIDHTVLEANSGIHGLEVARQHRGLFKTPQVMVADRLLVCDPRHIGGWCRSRHRKAPGATVRAVRRWVPR